MPSANYRLIRKAIIAEQQITCHYNGHYRELCPHILGHTNGEEKLLAFQFGGKSSKPLPRDGEWRGCRDAQRRCSRRLVACRQFAPHRAKLRCGG